MNKILFLSDNGTEHMADHLFHGLVELFGNESILDYPRKSRYHVKELKDTGNAYLNWCQCLDLREDIPHLNDDQLVDIINRGDIDLIISSIRASDVFLRLIDRINNRIKVIILNGEDDSDWHYRNTLLPKFGKYLNRIHMIMQREYKSNISFERKVIPFYGPLPLRNFPNLDFKKNKSIDVLCRMGDTHPNRSLLRNKLIEVCQKNGWKADISGDHYTMNEYFARMNDSKICVHHGGAGWESTHYLNIPLAKSLLLAQPPKNCLHTSTLKPDPTLFPNNFIDRESAVFYSNSFSDLESLISFYLNNDSERERVTINGYEHVINKLTSKHLAEYILACVENLDYWRSLV